jgi:hypothetical protein
LSKLVRADFLVDARSLTKVQGTPFRVAEVEHAIHALLREVGAEPAEPAGADGGAPADARVAETGAQTEPAAQTEGAASR